RRPWCISAMVRQMAKPMPMPSGLVVKKGSYNRSAAGLATPVPVSSKATSAIPSSVRDVRTRISRGCLPASRMASTAFCMRFHEDLLDLDAVDADGQLPRREIETELDVLVLHLPREPA